jgi:hypothetical protein
MKKMTALVVSVAFAFGMVGFAAAQTPAAPAPPAEKKDDMKKMDKKADKKADKLADCMAKAGTDDAKKADCEKKAAAAAKKAEKKAEKKDDAPKK